MTKIKEETKTNFSLAIEKKAVEEGIGYLDALSEVVEECSIEPQAAAKLINKSLKAKLEREAAEKRLIKTKIIRNEFIE